jgi:hypothetical protein
MLSATAASIFRFAASFTSRVARFSCDAFIPAPVTCSVSTASPECQMRR